MKKQRVPKKNIDSILVDVKKPNYDYGRFQKKSETVNLARIPRAPEMKFARVKKAAKKTFLAVVAALLILSAVAVFNLKLVKNAFQEGARVVAVNFIESIEAIKSFEFEKASVLLEKNKNELSLLDSIYKKNYSDNILGLVGNFLPQVKNVASLFSNISSLNSDFYLLARGLDDIQTNGFLYFKKDGGRLISKISETQFLIRSISARIEHIRNSAAELKKISGFFSSFENIASEEYLKNSSDLFEFDVFLGGLLSMFQGDENKHLLVLFQNAAEVRPGGGFVGSYADIEIKKGQLVSIDVRDIYDPDGQLERNVVPPSEIKTMSRNWGARDANWFFDFPTSARAILSFIESSKMYEERGITFDAVLGMNINVFGSILRVTGPIELEEYEKEISGDNFLREIQYEVEAGKDKIAGEPKRILKLLAPIVLEKLESLDSELMKELLTEIGEHFAKKDIMVYAKDQGIQHFLSGKNVHGGVYALPNNFFGSYLAVVNSNIAGGKTDVFMKQSISARVDLDSRGSIFTDLSVERSHEGADEKDPWWRAENKNFMQIYTNPDSLLVSIKGNDIKNIISTFDYEGNNYETYPDLEAIEKTKIYVGNFKAWMMQAFGKSVFGTWFNVRAGEKKMLEARYQSPGGDDSVVRPGKTYVFIYERQSAVPASLEVNVSAPLGYKWKESQSPFYIYRTGEVKAREIFQITLEKANAQQ